MHSELHINFESYSKCTLVLNALKELILSQAFIINQIRENVSFQLPSEHELKGLGRTVMAHI